MNNGPAKREYIRTSSATKFIHFENEQDANGRRRKERGVFEVGITEELSFTLTSDKVEQLQGLLDAARAQGHEGGVRVSLYGSQKINQESGEEFNSISLLVYPKTERQFGAGRGNQYGRGQRKSFSNQNARRNYPPQQNGGYQQNPPQQSHQNGAGQGTPQGGQQQSYPRTAPTTGGQVGNGQTVRRNVYPSNTAPRQYPQQQQTTPVNHAPQVEQDDGPPIPDGSF